MITPRRSSRARHLGPALLVVAGAWLLRLSWLRWPDVLIDYGTELYVPWRITRGDVLYRDVGNGFGPLADYLNAGLFRAFGVGLSTLAFFNIGVVALLCVLLYRFFRATSGHLAATAAGLCFLGVFAFAQYTGIANYNFICPYSYELTYGVVLSIAALTCLGSYVKKPSRGSAAAIGLLAGLVFLTKIEVAVAVLITVAAGLALTFRLLRPPGRGRHLAVLLAAFLLPAAGFLAYFSVHLPPREALAATLAAWTGVLARPLADNPFYLEVSGLDAPGRNLLLMLRQGALLAGLVVIAGLVAAVHRRLTAGWLRGAWALGVAAATLWAYASWRASPAWLEIARPFPLLLLGLLAWLLADVFARRADRTFVSRRLPLALMTLFAGLLLPKMLLNVRLYHYGFALAMPATLVIVAAGLDRVPDLLSRWGDRAAARAFLALCVLLAAFTYENMSREIYAVKNHAIGTGPDRFYDLDPPVSDIGPVVNATLAAIEGMLRQDDTFVVFPDGLMLNYLARRASPTPYTGFTPDLVEAAGEERVIQDLAEAGPSFVLLVERDTSEHGARYFGRDYARRLSAWVEGNHTRVGRIGAEPFTGTGFGVVIAKRNP